MGQMSREQGGGKTAGAGGSRRAEELAERGTCEWEGSRGVRQAGRGACCRTGGQASGKGAGRWQAGKEQASREQPSRKQASSEQARTKQASREQASREKVSRERAIEGPELHVLYMLEVVQKFSLGYR